MPPENSHSEFCDKLCLICLGKGPVLRPIKSKDCYSSKHDYSKYIKSSWWPAYNPENEKLPRVLCMNCRVKLVKNNDTSNLNPPSLPPKIMYEKLVFKPNTRINMKCDCEICLHGRFRWKELGGHTAFSVLPQPTNPQVDKRRKRPLSPQKESRCKTCLQVIGRGIRHQCNRSNKLENLSEIVKSTSKRTKSRVISGVKQIIFAFIGFQIYNILGELNQAFSEVSSEKGAPGGQAVISLATRGPKPLKISKMAPKAPVITHQDLINLQNRINLSDRGIK